MDSPREATEAPIHPPKALAFLQKMRERHGDMFTIRMVGERLLVVSAPDLAKQIFQAPANALLAGAGNRRVLEWLFGDNSLMLLDGRRHLRHRRLLLPPFHGDRLERRVRTMREIAGAALASWPTGEEVAALGRLQALALEMVMSATFGNEGESLGPLRTSLKGLQLSRETRGDGSGSFEESLRSARALIDRYVTERRGGDRGSARSDVLALLLEARAEDGSAMSHQEICDELLTLVVAGTETTSGAIAWTLELLARSPGPLAQVAEEASDGGGPYTNAVIYEALRMRPPVPMSALRVADRPFRLGQRSIPPGTIVGLSALLIHHRPDVYPDPLIFRPERFLERAPDTYAWIPFGGGLRRCLGASFALLEMRIVLSALLARMTLRAAAPEPEAVRNQGNTIVPARGTRIVLEPRS